MQRTLEMCVSIRACSSLLNPSSLSYSRRMRTRIFVVILRCSNDYWSSLFEAGQYWSFFRKGVGVCRLECFKVFQGILFEFGKTVRILNRIFEVYVASCVLAYFRILSNTPRVRIRFRAKSVPNMCLFAQCNTTLAGLLDRHAPLKTKTVTVRPQVSWYSEEICETKRAHRRAERKWRTTRSVADLVSFKRHKNHFTHLLKEQNQLFSPMLSARILITKESYFVLWKTF